MELKAARCPSCGGDLDVPEEVDFVECPYCGIDVKVRDIVSHELDTKSILELASHAYNTGNYKPALEYYLFILDKEPGNSFALLGKVKSTLKQNWEQEEKKTEGVKEFILENIGGVEDDKRQKYLNNVSDLICELYDNEINKYKDDTDFILKSNNYIEQLLYLLETSNEINPGHEKTITKLMDYFLLMRRLNASAIGSIMKEERVDRLHAKYSEMLGNVNPIKAVEYGKKWDKQVIAERQEKSYMKIGLVGFIVTLIVIVLIVWVIIKIV